MQFTRRDFLQFGFGATMASALSPLSLPGLSEAEAADASNAMKIVKFNLKVGATKPFKALHISDTHITFADERETERKQQLAEKRSHYFGRAVHFLNAAVNYAKENDELLLHTGDLIDFVSEKNCEYVSDFYKEPGCDHFNSSGNHEFSHYLGEAPENEDYKMLTFDRIQAAFPNDLRFCSKIVNGVNFIAFDDVYYYVAEDLIEKFKKEVEKGLPIVTMCHIPFYTPELFKFELYDQKEAWSYTIGVPEDVIKEHKQERYRAQIANQTTSEFIAWLKEQSLVKALLCGHLHVNFDEQFSESARQYVVGGNFKGDAYEFTFE